MAAKEVYYPNIHEHGYTYSRIENLSYVPHVHMGMECVYMLRGNLIVTIDGKNYNLREGDISVVMPYRRHSYLTRQDSEVIAFSLLPENVLMQSPYFSGKYGLATPVLRSGKYSRSVNILFNLLLDEQTRASNVTTHMGLLNAIIGFLFDTNPPQLVEADRLSVENEVMLYLHNNLYKPITLMQAAEDLNISQFRLSRICNQEIGIGFNAYLKSMRIAAAKRRLAFTDLSIAEIAEDTGFESLRTFNRAFSEEAGSTPRAYRAKHKDKTTLNFRPEDDAHD